MTKEKRFPSHRSFLPILARYLAENGPVDVTTAVEAVAEACRLTDADRSVMSESVEWEPKYRNVIRWARQDLNFAGLLDRSVGRGFWALNDEGRKLVAKYRKDDAGLARAVYEHQPRKSSVPEGEPVENEGVRGDATPDEVIVRAVQIYDEYIKGLLRRELANVTPQKFEHIVAEVLTLSLRAVERHVTPPSRDGGIDGVLYLDHLRLNKVVFQAKQYTAPKTVSRVYVDAFYAAAKRENASAMVFVTTSSYTVGAKTAAQSFGIRTIAGDELVDLMLKVGVGVRMRQQCTLHTIDDGYFSEEE